jgi:hypothetical protein
VAVAHVNLNPTTAASVDFIVTFSEAVTGVDPTDFRLSMTGPISGAVVSGVSGSGTTVRPGSGRLGRMVILHSGSPIGCVYPADRSITASRRASNSAARRSSAKVTTSTAQAAPLASVRICAASTTRSSSAASSPANSARLSRISSSGLID